MFFDGAACRSGGHQLRRLVVFDLDGTVIDSKPVMIHAFQIAYDSVVGAGEPPVDGFLRLLGAPFPDILAQLGLPAQMYGPFRAISRAGIDDVTVHRDVLAACGYARAAGCRTAIHTGKDRERTVEILSRFRLSAHFDGIVAGDDPYPGKPAPDGLHHLCRGLAVDPADTVVVGDSALDMESGRAAGATTVGCLWGMGTEEELRSAGADVLLTDAGDLRQALERWLDRTLAVGEAR